MPHPLELKYGLTAQELLDAIDRRFRLKIALEGAVAEVHFERKLKVATREGWLRDYQAFDQDGEPDYSFTANDGQSFRVEVKTVRNKPVAKVELQKTRAAKADPSSRYYDYGYFDVVAVCLGRISGDWSQFMYAIAARLPHHRKYKDKIQVMHKVPEPGTVSSTWFSKLQDLLDDYE